MLWLLAMDFQDIPMPAMAFAMDLSCHSHGTANGFYFTDRHDTTVSCTSMGLHGIAMALRWDFLTWTDMTMSWGCHGIPV